MIHASRGRLHTRFILAAAAFSLFITARFARAAEPAPRPNIVIIMADDMGYSDLGCYGSEIATPTIDRLAAGGLRFTQFYNTARCCPTRAALLTGVYQHQAGVGHMVEDRGAPGYRGYLNDRCVTLAEALKPAGYHVLMSGKWHVGGERPHWPVDRGFERYYGLVDGGSNYFRLSPGRTMAIDGEEHQPDEEGFYVTDAFSDYAVRFIDEYAPREAPFLLYLAYTAPHWPLHAHEEDIAKYRGKYLEGWDALRARRHARLIEEGLVEEHWPLTPRDSRAPDWDSLTDEEKEAWDLKMAVYAAQIDRMDQGIGRVVEKLDSLGELENTLILFLCDNGGCAEHIDRGEPGVPPGGADSFLSYDPPWANASNTPFRLYKHWVHEGGVATPLVAHWPRMIAEPGAVTHQVGHVMDLMATCLDAAGGEYPSEYEGREIVPLVGKSLLPILRGETRAPHDPLFWEHEGNRAVRQGDWKLVARHGGEWELYDLAADRTEVNNLTAAEPERVRRMAEHYDRWAAEAGVEDWNVIRRARRN